MTQFIRRTVSSEVEARFQNRDVVVNELAHVVLERAVKHGKFYVTVIGIMTIGVGFMGYQKLSDFDKTVEKAKLDVVAQTEAASLQALEAQGKAAEAVRLAESAEEQVNLELEKMSGSAAAAVEEMSTELNRIRNVVLQFEGETTELRSKATGMVADIGSLQAQVAEQSQMLNETDQLVRSVVEGQKVEGFMNAEDQTRMAVVEQEPRKASVYILLEEAPLPKSLRVQWDVYSQPLGSFGVLKGNLIFMRWADLPARMHEKPLIVEYFPDKGYADPLFKSLEVRDGQAFVDGKELPLLFQDAKKGEK